MGERNPERPYRVQRKLQSAGIKSYTSEELAAAPGAPCLSISIAGDVAEPGGMDKKLYYFGVSVQAYQYVLLDRNRYLLMAPIWQSVPMGTADDVNEIRQQAIDGIERCIAAWRSVNTPK